MTFSLYRNLFGEIFHYKSYDALLNELKKNRQKNGQTKKYSTVLYEQIKHILPVKRVERLLHLLHQVSSYFCSAPHFFFGKT